MGAMGEHTREERDEDARRKAEETELERAGGAVAEMARLEKTAAAKRGGCFLPNEHQGGHRGQLGVLGRVARAVRTALTR